jgi:hypothetical protein
VTARPPVSCRLRIGQRGRYRLFGLRALSLSGRWRCQSRFSLALRYRHRVGLRSDRSAQALADWNLADTHGTRGEATLRARSEDTVASTGCPAVRRSLRWSVIRSCRQASNPDGVPGRISPLQPQVQAGAYPMKVPCAQRLTSVQVSLNAPSRYRPATYPQWPSTGGTPTLPVTIT